MLGQDKLEKLLTLVQESAHTIMMYQSVDKELAKMLVIKCTNLGNKSRCLLFASHESDFKIICQTGRN
jgi:hypothetical protein